MAIWGHCVGCLNTVDSGECFCTACGTASSPASRSMVCSKCDAGYPADCSFCKNDGVELISAVEAATASARTVPMNTEDPPDYPETVAVPMDRAALSAADARTPDEHAAEPPLGSTSAREEPRTPISPTRALEEFWEAHGRALMVGLGAAVVSYLIVRWIVGGFQGNELWYGLAMLPAVAGILVGLIKSEAVSEAAKRGTDWLSAPRDCSRSRMSGLWKWVRAPLTWADYGARRLSGPNAEPHTSIGLSVAMHLYVLLLLALAASVVVMVVVGIVLTILAIWAGLWILGQVLGGDVDAPRLSAGLGGARRGKSITKSDWLSGERFEQHLDEHGRPVATTRDRKDWLTNEPFKEHTDRDGRRSGSTRGTQDWLTGEQVEKHFDDEGRRIGETRHRKDWLTNESYDVHLDKDGKEVGETRNKKDWLTGDPYREHKPKE